MLLSVVLLLLLLLILLLLILLLLLLLQLLLYLLWLENYLQNMLQSNQVWDDQAAGHLAAKGVKVSSLRFFGPKLMPSPQLDTLSAR